MGTRDQILDAAAEVMHTRGLARTTTKEIARAAGYSEATLYKHFRDKTDLFLAVLTERVPSFSAVLADIAHDPEAHPLRDNLIAIARGALAFYHESFPISASVFSEPTLLAAHRDALTARKAGPHKASAALARYLRAEQKLGRVAHHVDCDAIAGLLLGACLHHAFLTSFAQHPLTPAAARTHATTTVDALLPSLV
ncbi:TetR/AcrR family transcriptional regulator [Actinocatenispora rupis]|uniref:TetR family transcriptional regulator n=1 Tax=Actinocatenispora rupis TaxID=519421 RepID=A0A8J3IZX0_9ACTN|nr:TetR/AcrR family transcriptional regulator [Actinocatenispora rupis]GID11940.1 TetR family transcriptional regulator [Actinocatenispora rupis]